MSALYRVTHQVVPKLSIQGRYGFYIGPELRVSEQPGLMCHPVLEFHWIEITYTGGKKVSVSCQ